MTLLAAEISTFSGLPGTGHLVLLVHSAEDWLVDGGFGGEGFRHPLLLKASLEQVQGKRSYRLDHNNGQWVLQLFDGQWRPFCYFRLQPRELSDFTDILHYYQTSPESIFTQRRICTLATRQGRIMLIDRLLITTVGKERQKRLLASEEEYIRVLSEQFGIVLPNDQEQSVDSVVSQ